jgi:hypothetical protein
MVSEYLPVGIGVPAGWYSEYPLVGINTIIGIKEVEIKVRLNSIVRSGLKNGI